MKKEDLLSDEFLKQFKTGEDLNVFLAQSWYWNQSKANDHNEEHFPKRHLMNVGPQNRILKIETQGAHNHSHNNHWL